MRVIRKGIETAVAKNKLGEVAAAVRDGIHIEPAVAVVKPAEAMLPLSGRADGEVETAQQIVLPGTLVEVGRKQCCRIELPRLLCAAAIVCISHAAPQK